MPQESIVNASEPNAGRIYDYILGGYHNFEVDRQAAERVRSALPFFPKAARLQRWCLQDLALELTENRGFDVIVDFASGLPTNDHIHLAVSPETTAIYSDIDPVVVEYAHEILENTPNVYFFQSDARRPEELLNRREVQDILGDRRQVALICWGIAAFLQDEDLAHAARYLHEWAGQGSCLAFQAMGAGINVNDPAVAQALDIYAQMGSVLYFRSLEKYRELIQPWQPDEGGFVSLLEWHGFDQSEMAQEDVQAFGPTGAGYGVYLVK